jgi:leucyl aminopeptidase
MKLISQKFNVETPHKIILIEQDADLAKIGLGKDDLAAAKEAFAQKQAIFHIHASGKSLTIYRLNPEAKNLFEDSRKSGHLAFRRLAALGAKQAALTALSRSESLPAAFAEGMLLSSYQFLKYKTEGAKPHSLQTLAVDELILSKARTAEIQTIVEANFIARNLVNEPLTFLTAVQLSKEIQALGKKAGFKVTVFDKKKIESLKMGGLLAVNRGSQRPPTFTVMEYKPKKSRNSKPIVLVGKGVVYDTGGLSLKPTPASMDMMKCDMSGAAAVAGILYGIALLKLPVHVVGLIPATDNRPGEDAYTPGDVIHMMSGLNVEVLNTDAEGRMILADALFYAQRYKPELVCDYATLTGAAARAIGTVATALMGNAPDAVKQKLHESGHHTYERLAELPLFDEYDAMIKSDVADIKNIGGADAGAQTAAMFLKRFTNYPWLHFDIAGPAYIMAEDAYRGKYATGVCVRLMIDFLKNYSPDLWTKEEKD